MLYRVWLLGTSLALLTLAGCSQTPSQPVATASASVKSVALTETQKRGYLAALDAASEGDYPSAINRLKTLTREAPNHPGSWLNLAAIYYQAEQAEPMAHALEQASKLDPDNALVHNLKGASAVEQGNIDQAEEHYRLAVAGDQNLAEAHYNLALLHDTYYQDIATALTHYRAYLKLVPEDETTARWVEQLQRSLANH